MTIDNGILGRKRVNLENTTFVPELKTSLISISKAASNSRTTKFYANHTEIVNQKSEIVLIVKKKGDLYFIQQFEESTYIANISGFSELH